MQIDISKGLNLAADDPEGWKKAITYAVVIVVCTLASFLILPLFFLLLYPAGYVLQYIRNVATGDMNKQLPAPVSTGGLWHGFIALLVGVVYSLPLMGVMFFGFGTAIAGLATGARMDSTVAALGGMAGMGLMAVVAIFLCLVIAVIAPMIALQYCRNYQFADCFNVGAILSGIMRSPVDYALVILVPFGLSCVAAVIPFLNLILSPIVGLMAANLIGQYGAKVLRMEENSPAPVSSDVGFSKF